MKFWREKYQKQLMKYYH